MAIEHEHAQPARPALPAKPPTPALPAPQAPAPPVPEQSAPALPAMPPAAALPAPSIPTQAPPAQATPPGGLPVPAAPRQATQSPSRPASRQPGRHRAAPLSVTGQIRHLAAVRHGGTASRHRARRRVVPKAGGPLGTALASLDEVEALSWVPVRLGSAEAVSGVAEAAALPDVQFDVDAFVAPAQTIDGLEVQVHPVHTVFVTARLLRFPTADDRHTLEAALAAVETYHAFRPEGVLTQVAYGLPYFRRLPGGLSGPLAFRHLPRLRADASRFVLEEAAEPAEDNDLLLTLRSDKPGNIRDVLNWLRGSNTLAGRRVPSPRLAHLLAFTSSRAMSVQVGLPRKIANARGLGYAGQVDFRLPTWTGRHDGRVDRAREDVATPAAVTFAGPAGARLSTADAGDYFDNGTIQHLCHAVLDLDAHLAAAGPRAIAAGGETAAPDGPHRLVPAREASGPLPHVPIEGAGFDGLDRPDGAGAPKLHAGGLYPTAELAARDQLPAFATVTRRQNFLVPPRRHRAFPLAELA